MLQNFRLHRTATLALSLLMGAALSGPLPVLGQGQPNENQSKQQTQTAPDNSASNKGQDDTAQDQSNTKEDREIARKLRKAIVADKTLSNYGKNVKIIARGGSVTLKGPVTSDDEKKKIGDLAAQIAGGADKVDNQLTVTPS